MTRLTYAQVIRDLFPRLTGGIRWGLERTESLLAAVGDPHRAYPTVHVGGTNGKGSVAATLAAVLRSSGRHTGLYTSPHLCSFRERVQVDGRPVSEAAVVAAAARLWPAIRDTDASFFEATTAIAFLALAEAGVEVAVIEVGLGGRLDSTNVITPAATILTNVSLDHTELLGTSVTEIAREKAGIIKAGVPVIAGESEGEAAEIWRRRALELGAPFHALGPAAPDVLELDLSGTRFRLRQSAWGELDLRTPLAGPCQARNAALAVLGAGVLPPRLRPAAAAVRDGVARVRWPGRFQVERVGAQTWILDAAHNPAGASALADALARLAAPRPRAAVIGILSDKDWRNMLPRLAAEADAVVLTVPDTAPEHRRWNPADGLGVVPGAEVVPSLAAALRRAGELAGGPDAQGGTVVVTGSAHTVGDALIAIGRAPWGADPIGDPDAPDMARSAAGIHASAHPPGRTEESGAPLPGLRPAL